MLSSSQSLQRYSIVSSANSVISNERNVGNIISASLYDEDLAVKDGIPSSNWSHIPSLYKGSAVRLNSFLF